MGIRKWILLGPGNGEKTRIVMKCLLMNPFPGEWDFVFLSDSETGRAVEYARQNGVQVFVAEDQRLTSEEALSVLASIDADTLVSCGWNYRIPGVVLKRFRYPPINCHSSILPDYKGKQVYVHQWANCENEYGASIHIMDENLDEGRLLVQGRLQFYPKENIEMMHRRMSELTGALLPQALYLLESGYEGTEFDKGMKSRYFHRISPAKARLHRIFNRIMKVIHGPVWLTPHDGE